MAPLEVTPQELDLERWIRPGAGVVVGHCCAEPVALVDALVQQRESLTAVSVFVGMLFRDRMGEGADELSICSYGGHGRTSRIPGLTIAPVHYSALPRMFAQGRLPGDVALVQVCAPDAHGNCSLGPSADYMADALDDADVIIAEVVRGGPRTFGATIPWERIDVAVHTARPLLEITYPEPGDVELAIAGHVAELVQDGDTLQFGVGALPEAILSALHGHRNLRVHSGVLSDGLLDLIEAGVVVGQVVGGSALGTRRLMDALHENDRFRMRETSYTHAPGVLATLGPIAAINGAIEVDMNGQAGSESVNGRHIGGIGGQLDFLRAAACSGGRPIIALPAARIVETLSGPVSAPKPDVDLVVTEHGSVSLLGLDEPARRAALRRLQG